LVWLLGAGVVDAGRDAGRGDGFAFAGLGEVAAGIVAGFGELVAFVFVRKPLGRGADAVLGFGEAG
jgi:hypothetical protein